MKPGAKLTIGLLVVLVLCASGILYVKHQFWKAQPAGAISIAQKESSPLDLRPATIAKLQQLVNDASDSLYKLRVDSLFTEAGTGSIILRGIGIYPDSSQMRRLHAEKKLPDDIFIIEAATFRITGIGLPDILHHRDLHFCCIACTGPRISIFHKAQPYNADERQKASRQSMFDRLHARLDRLAVDTILLEKGTLTHHLDGHTNVYRDVSICLRKMLLDSAAEKDQSRFLFAKNAEISAGAITMPADNSGYDLSMGSVSVSGPEHELTISNLALHPHAGRKVFLENQKERKCVYDLEVPRIVLKNVNWWAAANGESLLADEANILGAQVNVFLDQRIPAGPVDKANFPQQELMAIGSPVSVRRIVLKNANIVYDQFSAQSQQTGRMTFNDLDLTADYASNVPAEIAARPVASVHASCRFMNQTPMSANISLALPENAKGRFRLSMKMGQLNKQAVNSFSEALGLVRFQKGNMLDANAEVSGDNARLQGKIMVRYNDLHIDPLKQRGGDFKEKVFSKKLGNLFFIKDNNPGHDKVLRQPDFALNRTNEANFFGFVWEGLKLGLLKSIGVPPRLAGM